MAKEIVNPIGNLVPENSRKGENKTLPTWEFFYTGTLWRLTHGQRAKNVNSVPKAVCLTVEHR